ncbi:DUF1622 domain-containing protein [Gloeocapsopsis dulcis]|uniref:DUF1622 domain-containing protein n=1 Tax=Gloeocapsopsis dulcis AAB1 = 1H9 TaxID=1433147 RepID=A0A6N8G1I5_9CHRO|nr:DUF1622 domain-containing protein [Gloeocapsopsis dulcis]MUL39193.1 hypothetical protein [Gloeocapsopsis dulcis AAB1 = 1H9]WNN90765.1 DUF1622 domain-containing protein [Gloeocapsopsis dulcis]
MMSVPSTIENFKLVIDVETVVRILDQQVVSVIQLLALFVISIGIIKALLIFVQQALFQSHSSTAFQKSRLEMGYAFSLGLSFLVGASILKTIVAPSWDDIGKLGATILIRTVLNYLLLQAIAKQSITNNTITDNQPREMIVSAK